MELTAFFVGFVAYAAVAEAFHPIATPLSTVVIADRCKNSLSSATRPSSRLDALQPSLVDATSASAMETGADLCPIDEYQGRSDDRSPSVVPRRRYVKRNKPGCGRRSLLTRAATAVLVPLGLPGVAMVASAETIGKDPDCNDTTCLGVWDGLLADCPHGALSKGGAGCVSSQDDTPGIFAEPWDYVDAPSAVDDLDYEKQMKLLLPAIQLVCGRRGDAVKVLIQSGRYLRVVISDGKTGESNTGEFYFTPNDTTVQFRVASNGGLGGRPVRNTERCELIRKELRYLKLPVLRNRKRMLFFGESDDWDGFGPGSAALGPPAEMGAGEIEGGRGSDGVDPRLKIDVVQSFPFKSAKW